MCAVRMACDLIGIGMRPLANAITSTRRMVVLVLALSLHPSDRDEVLFALLASPHL